MEVVNVDGRLLEGVNNLFDEIQRFGAQSSRSRVAVQPVYRLDDVVKPIQEHKLDLEAYQDLCSPFLLKPFESPDQQRARTLVEPRLGILLVDEARGGRVAGLEAATTQGGPVGAQDPCFVVVAEGEESRGGGDGYDHTVLGEADGFAAAGDSEAASDGDEAGAQHAGVVGPLEADVLDRLVHLEELFELLLVR